MADLAIVTVSQKGQIVLPIRMREKLKIEEGSRLMVEQKEGKITLQKMENKLMDADIPFLLSHEVLAEDWLSEEDVEAWKDL